MSLKPRILVVDDEPEVQNLLSDLLAETGAEPCLTSSTLEAGRMINRQKFDGVFLSGKMPSGSANRLTRNIRRSRSNASCPIVMLTSNSSPAFLEESFRAGINFFIEKPIDLPHIRSLWGAIEVLTLDERRGYQRVPLRSRVMCRSGGSKIRGQCLNLSAKGLLAALDRAPPSRGEVRLEFAFPRYSQPVELKARVKRIVTPLRSRTPRQVGFRFMGLGRELERELMNFVGAAALVGH